MWPHIHVAELVFWVNSLFPTEARVKAFWICIYRQCSPFFFLFRVRVPRGACLARVLEQFNVPCNLWHTELLSTASAGPGGHCSASHPALWRQGIAFYLEILFYRVYDLLKTEGNWWRVALSGRSAVCQWEWHFILPFTHPRDPVLAEDVKMS